MLGQYGGPYADPFERHMWVVTGDSGKNLMWVDDKGNMVIRNGRCVTSLSPPQNAKLFRVKSGGNYTVLEAILNQSDDDDNWDVMVEDGWTHSFDNLENTLVVFKDSAKPPNDVFILYYDDLNNKGKIHIHGSYFDVDSTLAE